MLFVVVVVIVAVGGCGGDVAWWRDSFLKK